MKKSYWFSITGAFAGALGGYLYWYFIGCTSGSCPITSNPLHSTLYGVLLGTLMFNAIADLFKKNKAEKTS
jgi:hypothetical protein